MVSVLLTKDLSLEMGPRRRWLLWLLLVLPLAASQITRGRRLTR